MDGQAVVGLDPQFSHCTPGLVEKHYLHLRCAFAIPLLPQYKALKKNTGRGLQICVLRMMQVFHFICTRGWPVAEKEGKSKEFLWGAGLQREEAPGGHQHPRKFKRDSRGGFPTLIPIWSTRITSHWEALENFSLLDFWSVFGVLEEIGSLFWSFREKDHIKGSVTILWRNTHANKTKQKNQRPLTQRLLIEEKRQLFSRFLTCKVDFLDLIHVRSNVWCSIWVQQG